MTVRRILLTHHLGVVEVTAPAVSHLSGPNHCFTLSFVLLRASVCDMAIPQSDSETKVFPFKNKLVYVESKSVMLASN